jgi:hypothetical protein
MCCALRGPRCIHPAVMRLNSSSLVCLSAHSSADTHLHRPIFFVGTFGGGNLGFFVVLFTDGDTWGEHSWTAVAVGNGVFASSTLDVVVFVITAFEEDGCVGVRSVAGRLASSARLRSCWT